MKKIFVPVVSWLEAGGVWLVERGLGCLSLSTASRFGGWLLRTVGARLGADRTARRNLARCFSPAEVEALVPAVWDNLGRTFFEYPHLSRLLREDRVEYVGLEHLRAAAAAGRGGVLASAHLGNWEVVPFMAEKAGIEAAVMFRAPNNPKVAAELARCRSHAEKITFIAKSTRGTKEAFSFLAARKFVGLLIDHRYNRGIDVEFLGGTARIAPTAALMALRFRCPILPVRVERLPDCRMRVTVYPPLALDYDQPKEEFVATAMQQAMDVVAGWVRAAPEQWFWMQKLWG